MAKVFRLHEGQTGTGWFESRIIETTDLEKIKTDNVECSISIPSPYARMDMVRHAFKWVTNRLIEHESNKEFDEMEDEIRRDTAHHRLISDVFDIAQLFYNSNILSKLLTIESINPLNELEALEKSNPRLGMPLKLFWEQDNEAFNFDKFEEQKDLKLFFLKYNNILIGGTSPLTMFYANPDVRHIVNGNLKLGNIDFFKNVTPLYDRDKQFITYFFRLFKHPNFAGFFSDVHEYLEKTLDLMLFKKGELHQKLSSTELSYTFEEDKLCKINKTQDETVEVLGIPLGILSDIDFSSSDFLLTPNKDKKVNEYNLPLILPVEIHTGNWTYIPPAIKWHFDWRAPKKDDKDLTNRTLPHFGYAYPYLTLGDFFEDKIIKLPYAIDKKRFLCLGDNFFLPIKEKFFEYWTVEDLAKVVSFNNDLAGNAVEVKIELPVKGGTIRYRKVYAENEQIELSVYLAILPFVKTTVIKAGIDYTVGLLDNHEEDVTNDFKLTFYNKGNSFLDPDLVKRWPKSVEGFESTYHSVSEFDCIKIKQNSTGASALIIPQFPTFTNGASSYSFAMDFGTTNTHIEYRVDGDNEKSLDIRAIKPFYATLLDKNAKTDSLNKLADSHFQQELLPMVIGPDEEVNFPLRTAIVVNNELNYDLTDTVLFKHLNNSFIYESKKIPEHLKLETELKWSQTTNPHEQTRVKHYIECLIRLVYYKVLTENGNLHGTKITWFYPVSMTDSQVIFFKAHWNNLFEEIFGLPPVNHMKALAESIAPFYYYHNKLGVVGRSVSIDIGGGSSDIAVFEMGTCDMISSFRFAGDTIYGDGYGGSTLTNGFVRAFRERAEIEAKRADLGTVLNKILFSTGNSKDFSSFLFSLSKNKSKFDYNEQIANTDLKLSVLIFFSAIIYYVAKLMKKRGYKEIPQNILFSGTASKSLHIIDASEEASKINNVITSIFQKLFKTSSGETTTGVSEIPKELTCKGGLCIDAAKTNVPICFWIGGDESDLTWSKIEQIDSPDNTPIYKEALRSCNDSIITSIMEFYVTLDSILEKRIYNDFNITHKSYQTFKKMRCNNLKDHINRGIKRKLDDFPDKNFNDKKQHNLQETLFFYPLVGVLNQLSSDLAGNNLADNNVNQNKS